jgi:ubiquinone/menaquinone biosynthesis C-methylase UbiE
MGASVVASDLAPELFDAGRGMAARHGVEVDWREADAEALPFADGEFDVVLSCVGVMFAPHHQVFRDQERCKPLLQAMTSWPCFRRRSAALGD